MATGNPLHPDTADRFNDESYNPDSFGTRNAQVTRSERKPRNRIAADRKRSRFAPIPMQDPLSETINPNQGQRTQTNVQPIRPKTPTRTSRLVESGKKIIAKVGTKVVSVFLYLLIGFCTPIQMVLGVLAGLAFFISAGLYSITDEASLAAAILSYAGITPDNFLFVYWGLSGLILILNILQIVIGSILFKSALAHPLGGRGSTFKIVTLMLILIASFIPLLQCLPLIWTWIIVVNSSPR